MRVLPTNDEDDQEVAFTCPVSVRLQDIESHRAEYANLIHCNFDRAAFQVVFAQFLQPLILSSEDAKELGERGFIPARPLTRLILTPQMVRETIELLQRQLANFEEQSQVDKPFDPEDHADAAE